MRLSPPALPAPVRLQRAQRILNRGALAFTALAASLLSACQGAAVGEESTLRGEAGAGVTQAGGKRDAAEGRVAIFLTSHGDVNEPEEIEPYIRSAFLKNVGVPLPKTLRELLEDPAYWLSKDLVEGQYEAIGPTYYHENALRQVEALERALAARGVKASVYLGYNFMPEFIEDTARRMREDGVTEIVVFNKGAQYSLATLGESITELEVALEEMPDWDVKVTAVRQFSSDPRFAQLLADVLRRDAERFFPDVPPADVCVLMASHGLPMRLINMGDPAVDQMRATVEDVRALLPEYPLYHGFLNDDFFPGAEWVAPKASVVAQELRALSCPAVLMDSRLSFTTHHRATLYDLDVEVREIVEEPDFLADGVTPHPLWTPSKAVLAPQWDDEPEFALLLADLAAEALRGEGDLIKVR
ncbi:MAG: ferrochelatase [Deltaproteobacteria bacterium]|nr:ferrochelatase [Deltaproteobacteria bacterium]